MRASAFDVASVLTPGGLAGVALTERLVLTRQPRAGAHSLLRPGVLQLEVGPAEQLIVETDAAHDTRVAADDSAIRSVTWIRGWCREAEQRAASTIVRRELRRRHGDSDGDRRAPSWRTASGSHVWTCAWRARETPDGTKGLFYVKVVMEARPPSGR